MKRTLHLLLCTVFVIGCIHTSEAQIISTIAGTGVIGSTGDGGPAASATFITPTSIALDNAGNIYINDQGNGFIVSAVRKIDHTTGNITTIAGSDSIGFGGNGLAATAARLDQNWGIAVDGPGNVYIADEKNHRVRKVNVSGIITTVVGTGAYRYFGDGGAAATAGIESPIGITLDEAGNLYICDQDTFVIRKVNTAGVIKTIAGFGGTGFTGDGGQATNATFADLYSIATDGSGNLYICDGGNNCVRKVSPSGIISTVAGIGGTPGGYNADGIPAVNAKLNHPTGVYVDGPGNIYIADYLNNRIRKVNTSGIISTIAGTGTPGFYGDNGMATDAQLDKPLCITMDSIGNLYFSDMGNARIRKISKDLTFSNGHKKFISVCQNVSTSIDSVLAIQDLDVGLTDTWSPVMLPTHGTLAATYSASSTGGIVVPSGLYYNPASGYFGNDSFSVRVDNVIDSNFITVYVTVIPTLSYGGVINGPSFVCVGSSITLTDSTGNGTWSIVNLNATVTNGVVKGQSPGTDTVKYTITNACGSVTASKLITIYPLPYAGNITGLSEICMGSGAIYIDTTSNGTWSSTNSKLAIAPSGLAAGVAPGTDTIFYTVRDAFCAGSTSFIVNIDSFPVPGITPWDSAICVGDTVHITGSPVGGVWAVNNTTVSFLPGPFTSASAGQDSIKYSITNACGTGTAYAYITVNPLPDTPTITQSGSVLSVPSGYSVYQWLFNGAPILGSIVDTYLVDATGKYAVYVRNTYGCAVTSQSIESTECTPDDIVVYPNPTESIVYIKWCKKMIVRVICDDGKTVGVANGVNEIDLGNLPNADYLVVLYDMNGKKLKTKRVTKLTR